MTRRLGRYQLLHHLATGGMAEIWLARHHGVGGFEKLVVIKRILPHLAANSDFVQMFLDEGRLAAQLSHPNIVQIFDLAQDGNDYFLAMEFVRGENLHFLGRRLADRGGMAMPVTYAAKILSQVCEALHYAHTKTDFNGEPLGLVHRDVSPANLILSYEGQVKVVDFGIAKAANKIQATRAGMVKGNYGYMSPEQASGRPLDHRSDIFALGIILWEMVTGSRLYDSESDLALVRAICEEPPARPRTVRRGIPPDLEAIILKGLEKDPDRRFQDCNEMHLSLERFIHGQGAPVTPVHLSRYMRSVFPDRLKAWQRVIQGEGERVKPEVVRQISTVFVSDTQSNPEPTAGEPPPSEPNGFDETVQMPVPKELLQSMTGADGAVEAVAFEETVTQESSIPRSLLDTMATPPPSSVPWMDPAPPTTPLRGISADATVPAYPALSDAEPTAAARPGTMRPPAARSAAVMPGARPAPRPPPPAPPPPARGRGVASANVEWPVGGGPIPDDDDDEENEVPLFPELPLDALLGSRDGPAASPIGDRNEKPVAEVLYHDGGVLLDSAVLRQFQGYRARRNPRLARMGTRTCTVHLPAASRGVLRRARGGLENVAGPTKIVLDENDRIDLEHQGFHYRVRVYRPPSPPRSPRSPFSTKIWGGCVGGAVGIHALLLVAFMLSSVVGVKIPVANKQLAERFAEIKTPAQIEHKVHRRRPHHHHHHIIRFRRPDPTEAAPQLPRRLQRRIARITRRFRHRGGGRGSGGTTSLLNALRSPVRGNGKTLKDVVSNIDAVSGKGGHSRGAFKVAGTLAAFKGGKVNLATGGGGAIGTLSGTEIAGNGVGRLRGRGGGGRVRGRVHGIRALAQVHGSLSRAQVLKVINEHLGQIQGCYERALNHHPGLAGKIEFEWTVRANGRVSVARERSSSMNSARVSQCIIHVIRRMRFPRPKGGSVTIAYPFMFRSVPS